MSVNQTAATDLTTDPAVIAAAQKLTIEIQDVASISNNLSHAQVVAVLDEVSNSVKKLSDASKAELKETAKEVTKDSPKPTPHSSSGAAAGR